MIRKILLFIKPLLRTIGKIHLPGTHKKVTGVDYVRGRPLWRNGTIFASRYDWEPSNILISGYWKHIAMFNINPYAEPGSKEYVIEAVDPVVRKNNMIDYLRKDGLIAIEPILKKNGIEVCEEIKNLVMERAAGYAREEIGLAYDYNLDWQGNSRSELDIQNWRVQREFYCSELGFWSYKRACADYEVEWDFHLKERLGLLTLTPQDWVNDALAGRSNRVIWKDMAHS